MKGEAILFTSVLIYYYNELHPETLVYSDMVLKELDDELVHLVR